MKNRPESLAEVGGVSVGHVRIKTRAKAGHVEESSGFRRHGWRAFMHQRRPQFETCTSANSASKRVDSGFSWAVGRGFLLHAYLLCNHTCVSSNKEVCRNMEVRPS